MRPGHRPRTTPNAADQRPSRLVRSAALRAPRSSPSSRSGRSQHGRGPGRAQASLADKITRPLLIGQGDNDPRVNIAESERDRECDDGARDPVTYVIFPDEGHGFARPANNFAFFGIAEQFLSRCLGGWAEPLGNDVRNSSAKVPEDAALVPGLADALALR